VLGAALPVDKYPLCTGRYRGVSVAPGAASQGVKGVKTCGRRILIAIGRITIRGLEGVEVEVEAVRVVRINLQVVG